MSPVCQRYISDTVGQLVANSSIWRCWRRLGDVDRFISAGHWGVGYYYLEYNVSYEVYRCNK